jgi:hypothetical protein
VRPVQHIIGDAFVSLAAGEAADIGARQSSTRSVGSVNFFPKTPATSGITAFRL